MGSQLSLLSKITVADAIPDLGRFSEPENIMSSVFFARNKPNDCSPKTQRKASAILDFPDPFGPTMAVIPSENRNSFREANVLYPCSSNDFNLAGIAYLIPNFSSA